MIVVTGAAGFIASGLVGTLNRLGIEDIVIVDDFAQTRKIKNWETKKYVAKVQREDFFEWFDANATKIDFIFHLGARTDTTEFNWDVFQQLNLDYTRNIWTRCCDNNIPLIYASSAATYGNGEYGYIDDHNIVSSLKPLNPYGRSKNEFDLWALAQEKQPPFWVATKFFNVYGPNEYHKGRMASVVLHTFETVKKTGKMQLFRSHNPKFEDGMQLRDFIYVKDVIDILIHMYKTRPTNGLYNVGTGNAESFLELATSTFIAMDKLVNIEFVDMPEDIRDKYQYFTEADTTKLRKTYNLPMHTLREGVADYVKNYLIPNNYL